MYKSLFLILFLFIADYSFANDHIGESECLACHKEVKQAYKQNIHAKVFTYSQGEKFEVRGCEACHGPGKAHKEAVDNDEKDLRIEAFRKDSGLPAEKNGKCLACHEKGKVSLWQGSGHDMSGVSCASCHKVHAQDFSVKMDVCFICHKERRAQLQRSSHMPLREGKMSCNDCHNPHGGPGPGAIKTATINENCYNCHEEKRGPMVWEHAPVRENCATCHDPHGSNYESLLKFKNPYLCQSCHDVSNHPSTLYDGNKLPGKSPAQQLLGKGCLNCHSLIHGSNHPSGARFQR